VAHDDDGTPFRRAEQYVHTDIVALLKQHGAEE
jgi:hypothetical protein